MLLESTLIALRQITTIQALLFKQPVHVSNEIFIKQRVGAHIRHVHDHFRSLFIGLDTGIVDYNVRNRESREEHDFSASRAANAGIISRLSEVDANAGEIVIVSEINCQSTETLRLSSTVNRELLYLINHTIHHAAIIKFIMQNHDIPCPKNVGLAPSTASYCRQLSAAETICDGR